MKDKPSGKFRKEKKRKNSVLAKNDINWLAKNTHFDPENIKEWHKVREYSSLNSE